MLSKTHTMTQFWGHRRELLYKAVWNQEPTKVRKYLLRFDITVTRNHIFQLVDLSEQQSLEFPCFVIFSSGQRVVYFHSFITPPHQYVCLHYSWYVFCLCTIFCGRKMLRATMNGAGAPVGRHKHFISLYVKELSPSWNKILHRITWPRGKKGPLLNKLNVCYWVSYHSNQTSEGLTPPC